MKHQTRMIVAFLRSIIFLVGLLSLWNDTCLADNTDRAKAKLQEGRKYIAQEDYLSALRSFQESYRLEPKGSVLFNIGMCFKALYRHVEAIDTFKRFIMKASERDALKKKARAAIKELERLIGKVRLRDAPNGAEVMLDNKKIAETPLQGPILVDPGQHSLQVFKKGYKSLKIDITVVSGAVVSVRAALTKQAALIHVACTGENAVVRVNSKVVGGCPYKGEVKPGLHQVLVTAPGSREYREEVEVPAGGEVVVSVGSLKRYEAVADEPGLSISTWSWIGIGSTVAAGIAAALLWGVAGSKHDDFISYSNDYENVYGTDNPDSLGEDLLAREKTQYEKVEKAAEDTELFNGLAIATTVLAGLLATGTAMMIILDSDDEESTDPRVSAAPHGVSVRF
jgi:hypothetical protein